MLKRFLKLYKKICEEENISIDNTDNTNNIDNNINNIDDFKIASDENLKKGIYCLFQKYIKNNKKKNKKDKNKNQYKIFKRKELEK